MPKQKLNATAPELLNEADDAVEDAAEETATPEERTARLEARILELEAKLEASKMELPSMASVQVWPEDPDELVEAVIPPGPTGFPMEVNGKKYVGKMKVKRRILDTVLYMLSTANQMEHERLSARGTEIPLSRLDPNDVVSRIKKRQQGQREF